MSLRWCHHSPTYDVQLYTRKIVKNNPVQINVQDWTISFPAIHHQITLDLGKRAIHENRYRLSLIIHDNNGLKLKNSSPIPGQAWYIGADRFR